MRPTQKALIAVLLLSSIIIIYGCRKFDFLLKKSTESILTVEAAKEWYFGVFKKKDDFKKLDFSSPFVYRHKNNFNAISVETEDTPQIRKFPYWDFASSYSRGALSVVEIPIFYETKYIPVVGGQNLSQDQHKKISDASFSKVLFLQKPGGEIIVRLVTFIPDSSYAVNKNYDVSGNSVNDIDESFSGYIIVRSWDEKIVNAIKIKNGSYLRRVKITKQPVNGNQQNSTENTGQPGGNGDLCGTIETPVYVTFCPLTGLTAGSDQPVHELGCPPELLENVATGEVTTEEYPPCLPPDPDDPIDLNELLNGLNPAEWNDCLNNGNSSETCMCNLLMICDYQSGNNGNNNQSPYNQAYINAILDGLWIQHGLKDSSNNPCVDTVLKTLTSINSKLPKLLRDFFDINAVSITMVIKSETNPIWPGYSQAPEGARTIWNVANDTFQVYINKYYENITDLGLAATLIHEAFHCQLLSWYRKAVLENNTQLQELLATNYGYIFPETFSGNNSLSAIVNGLNPSQHQDIVIRYKGMIEQALTEFASAKGINASAEYIRDIAWAGTDNSRAFQNLTVQEKERIRQNLGCEKDPYFQLTNPSGTVTVNGVQKTPKGAPCN